MLEALGSELFVDPELGAGEDEDGTSLADEPPFEPGPALEPLGVMDATVGVLLVASDPEAGLLTGGGAGALLVASDPEVGLLSAGVAVEDELAEEGESDVPLDALDGLLADATC